MSREGGVTKRTPAPFSHSAVEVGVLGDICRTTLTPVPNTPRHVNPVAYLSACPPPPNPTPYALLRPVSPSIRVVSSRAQPTGCIVRAVPQGSKPPCHRDRRQKATARFGRCRCAASYHRAAPGRKTDAWDFCQGAIPRVVPAAQADGSRCTTRRAM